MSFVGVVFSGCDVSTPVAAVTERRKPENEGRGDADELDQAVEAEVDRQWREARAAGWDYIPSKAKARERLTAPERERQEAQEKAKREREQAQEDRIRDLQERLSEQQLGDYEKRSPGPEPHPISRADFDKASRLLAEGTALRTVATETGLSRQDVAKIRDWRFGRGYEPELRPESNSVILRRV